MDDTWDNCTLSLYTYVLFIFLHSSPRIPLSYLPSVSESLQHLSSRSYFSTQCHASFWSIALIFSIYSWVSYSFVVCFTCSLSCFVVQLWLKMLMRTFSPVYSLSSPSRFAFAHSLVSNRFFSCPSPHFIFYLPLYFIVLTLLCYSLSLSLYVVPLFPVQSLPVICDQPELVTSLPLFRPFGHNHEHKMEGQRGREERAYSVTFIDIVSFFTFFSHSSLLLLSSFSLQTFRPYLPLSHHHSVISPPLFRISTNAFHP